MQKTLIFICSNIRKAKEQIIAIVILIVLAASLLNLWLMLTYDFKDNFYREHDRLNAEHNTLVYTAAKSVNLYDRLNEVYADDERISEYELTPGSAFSGFCSYGQGVVAGWFFAVDSETAFDKTVGRFELLEGADSETGIYLPYIFKLDAGYEVGDSFTVTYGASNYSYNIAGFYNNVMSGTLTCGVIPLVLSPDNYSELKAKINANSVMSSIRLESPQDDAFFEASMVNTIAEKFPGTILSASNKWSAVASSRYITATVCSAIIGAATLIVTAIALVLISSNLVNYIRENMKSLGVMKALGFTSKQMIIPLILEFVVLSAVAVAAGVALSYAIFPVINRMMTSQVGIPYELHFLSAPCAVCFAVILITVAAVVYLSVKRIRSIEPILAIRSSSKKGSASINRFPLDRVKLPLNLALAMKTAVSDVRRNVIIAVTMLCVSLVLSLSAFAYQNVIVDMRPMMQLIVSETADSSLTIPITDVLDVVPKIQQDERVEEIHLYTTYNVTHVGGHMLMAKVVNDSDELENKSMCYRGHLPKDEYGLAVNGWYAKEMGIDIGDYITLSCEGKQAKFVVTGLIQGADNTGKDCLLTLNGFMRMQYLYGMSFFVDLKDGVDIDEFNADMEAAYNIPFAINYRSYLMASAGSYETVLKLIVAAIMVISVLLIAFVLFLLIRILLSNKRRDYGILKSLGFTTSKLMTQTSMSFMPTMIVSTVIGMVISYYAINPLLTILLSSIGVMKCNMPVSLPFMIVSGVFMIAFAFIFSCALAMRIRSITPYKLLTND